MIIIKEGNVTLNGMEGSGPDLVQKMRSLRGISRAMAILLVLVAVMLVAVSIPVLRRYGIQSENIGCVLAITNRKWTMARHDSDEDVSGLCPSGGDVYMVDGDIICALHGKDKELCCRLNGQKGLEELEAALLRQRLLQNPAPDSVELVINSHILVARRVSEEPGITDAVAEAAVNEDELGAAAYYMLDEDGNAVYFLYATEYNWAVWRTGESWVVR